MQPLLATLIAAAASACYPPPVEAPISRPFIAPACIYCPGHRGLDYELRAGTLVHAVAGGVVTFSGAVAGIHFVVVLQDDGLAATYGALAPSPRHAGETVRTGEVLGASTDLLYFGLRDGDLYVDPQPRLGRWRRRPRLVPSGGARPRSTRAPTLQCPPTN